MIHQATALQHLRERFEGRDFSVKEAGNVLPFTHGTTLVALSTLAKTGLLERKKKGVYIIKPRENERQDFIRELKKPEINLSRGYATGTYALSNQLSPVTPPRYIDLFVPLADYPHVVAAIEVKDTFPEPYVYPFATVSVKLLKETIDGLKVTPPEVAFIDLIKIAVVKRRPVNLEYEIVPFISQLVDRWEKVRALAKKEGVGDFLEAIIFYVARLTRKWGFNDINLPKPLPSRGGIPGILSFTGGKADETSVEVGRKTCIVIEADQDAVRGVFSNI